MPVPSAHTESLIDCDSLFDSESFEKKLQDAKSPQQFFKRVLQESSEILNDAFGSGINVVHLVNQRAWFIDQLVIRAWQFIVTTKDITLVAVGGYGRRELHPYSDIDLMILQNTRNAADDDIQKFIAFLWDIGLEVGHSVRTIKDCVKEGRADITVITNLTESRFLAGQQTLFEAMCWATGAGKIWSTKKFFTAKLQEQLARHQKFSDTENNLEPNIKEGPGGLRDIQMIAWVTKRHFGVDSMHGLVEQNFLTEEEFQTLISGQTFLWRVRYVMQLLAGRCDDRLIFEYQRHVAQVFGYSTEGNAGVESFMKMYYQIVRELNCLNEILLQHFQEAIVYANRKKKIKPLNRRFHIRNDFIEVCNDRVFRDYPFALLELFLLRQHTLSIKGIRASTIRLLRRSLDMIDDDFRNDLRNKSLFMEIIRQPRHVGHELRRMHRYGILSRYLPAFGDIEGLMQFDMFHVYTVDEHILFVVRNMRLFGLSEYADVYPLCYQILQNLPKRELLYLAGLFHDIAKGRNGNHSKLGVKDALDFCHRHGISDYDSTLVAWLVENHLIFSKTAQREDIHDPEVLHKFALKVGDRERLQYLYLLTVADVCGTNPKLWNSWKDSLFSQLYNETKRILRRGLENPLNRTERIRDTKAATIQLLSQRTLSKFDTNAFWDSLGEDYFIRHLPDEIAWHTQAIANNTKHQYPLIKIRNHATRGSTEIFIYMQNQANIFAATTRALDQLGLNIFYARIITSVHGFTLDTYVVLDKAGQAIKDKERKKDLVEKIYRVLTNIDQFPKQKKHRSPSRREKSFSIPTRVSFSQDTANNRTIMEVTASDRPGFLSRIGTAMNFCGVSVHGAKISTYGSKVEDVFFITTADNQAIVDSMKFECLRSSIHETLN